MSATALLDMVRAGDPKVISLAEAVSLAVRVEPELLRRARLELVPDADASLEADLWFSALVTTRSTTAFMFAPDVADALRTLLARDRDRLDHAWDITREVHAEGAPAIALEEEVNYLVLTEGPASPALQGLLQRAVVALVEGGEDRAGVARWAIRAFARLPASVAETEAGQMLTVAARSRLGRADAIPPSVPRDADWLAWVLPRDAEYVRASVRLFDDGLEIKVADGDAGHVIPVPDTQPLILHVRWREDPERKQRVLRLDRARPTWLRLDREPLPSAIDDERAAPPSFTLETAWGDSYTLEPRQPTRGEISIRARAGTTEAFVVWRPSGHIEGCLGFALQRRQRDGTVQAVSNLRDFDPPKPSIGRPTTEAPLQRFTHLEHGLEAGDLLRYRAVAMIGRPDALVEGPASPWSDPISGSTRMERGLEVTFNRGVMGLTGIAEPGTAPESPLSELISTPGHEVREYLGGDLLRGLKDFLSEVQSTKGSLYAALYELTDPEAIAAVSAMGSRAHIVLEERFRPERASVLAREGVQVTFARSRGSGLLHHRFAVACDADGRPERVWVGGANWSPLGLCVQSNGATIIRDRAVASHFLAEWHRLREGDLHRDDAGPHRFRVGSATVTVWFTPLRGNPDLQATDELLERARTGILFAFPFATEQSLFSPGRARPSSLYIRGVTTGRTGRDIILTDGAGSQVIARKALLPPERWRLPAGNDFLARIATIDPFGRRPIVLTGSHNLTPTASSRNYESLLVVEDAPAFAEAHAVRIISLYQYYAFRAALSREFPRNLQSDDGWQERVLSNDGREIDFWLGASR
jgi:hypothetical protein